MASIRIKSYIEHRGRDCNSFTSDIKGNNLFFRNRHKKGSFLNKNSYLYSYRKRTIIYMGHNSIYTPNKIAAHIPPMNPIMKHNKNQLPTPIILSALPVLTAPVDHDIISSVFFIR